MPKFTRGASKPPRGVRMAGWDAYDLYMQDGELFQSWGIPESVPTPFTLRTQLKGNVTTGVQRSYLYDEYANEGVNTTLTLPVGEPGVAWLDLLDGQGELIRRGPEVAVVGA